MDLNRNSFESREQQRLRAKILTIKFLVVQDVIANIDGDLHQWHL